MAMRAIMPFCAEGCGCFSMLQASKPIPAKSDKGESAASLPCTGAPVCAGASDEPPTSGSRSLVPAAVQKLECDEMGSDSPKTAGMSTNGDDTTNTKPIQHDIKFIDEEPPIQVNSHEECTPFEMASEPIHTDELPSDVVHTDHVNTNAGEPPKEDMHEQSVPIKDLDASIAFDAGKPILEPTLDNAAVADTLPLPNSGDGSTEKAVRNDNNLTTDLGHLPCVNDRPPTFAGRMEDEGSYGNPAAPAGDREKPPPFNKPAPVPALGHAQAQQRAAPQFGTQQVVAHQVPAMQPVPATAGPPALNPSLAAANQEGSCKFRVCVPKPYPGVQYRRSKRFDDRHPYYAEDGAIVTGHLEDDGQWVRISGDIFLPVVVGTDRILEPLGPAGTQNNSVAVKGNTDGRMHWLSCCPTHKSIATTSEVVVGNETGRRNSTGGKQTRRC